MMRELFIFFSYFAFTALAFTCGVITYQIIRYGIGKTSSANEPEIEGNAGNVKTEDNRN
ncbi:hypothetical protein [Pueribacillus theae]|uniref:hypothetical protein n=1 Tax=Pueribacillus theae TaxID=2171751 RepID=UPI0014040EA7|nr:hypothetical protein [Pueribacillus theae]